MDMNELHKDAAKLRARLAAVDPHRVWLLLLEDCEGEDGAYAQQIALTLAYELGYAAGESNAEADFHEDNPEAIRRAKELLERVQAERD